MKTRKKHIETVKQRQVNMRIMSLRRWMYLKNITFAAIGRVCGISSRAAVLSLQNERMPVRHYQAITDAWPDFPVDLLPVARDVPTGPKPKGLELHEETA